MADIFTFNAACPILSIEPFQDDFDTATPLVLVAAGDYTDIHATKDTLKQGFL